MFDPTSFFNTIIESIKRQVSEQVQEASRKAYEEYFRVTEERVKELFQEVVSGWYGSYSPSVYGRNESMYEILETEVGPTFLRIEFDPSAMTTMRKGGTVYQLAFRSGFHGGAPGPNGMQYRTPVPFYYRWGRNAAVSAAPLSEMQKAVDMYSSGEGQRIYNELFMKYLSSINLSF